VEYPLLAVLSLGMGLSVAPIYTGVATLMQIVVPNEQRGRASAGMNTIIEAASVTSMSLAGFLGWLIGVPAVFFLGGLLCIAAALFAWWRLPVLTLKDMPNKDIQDVVEQGPERRQERTREAMLA
jgi:predicted MFS family arabinose efflux permease